MANELFSPGFQIDPEKDYTAELVGEGKDFASVKDLARSKVESNLFIEQLKRENAELREDLGRRKTVQDAISALQNTNTPANSANGGGTPAASSADPVALDEEAINQRIRETVANTLQQAQAAQSEQRNIELVKETLESAWGKNFSEKLTTVASELGVSQDYLSNLAKTSPKVFLRTVGADQPAAKQEPAGSLFAPSAAGVNTAGLARSNASNLPMEEKYSYWQKVRKENPTLYHSPDAAAKRFEAAKKHGDAFFAN